MNDVSVSRGHQTCLVCMKLVCFDPSAEVSALEDIRVKYNIWLSGSGKVLFPVQGMSGISFKITQTLAHINLSSVAQ